MSFGSLKVEVHPGGECELLEDLMWEDPSGHMHIVPAGFYTDFASIPRVMRLFAVSDSLTSAPATLHDYHYRVILRGRRWADSLFYQGLRDNGVHWFFAWSYWFAVRVFGWYSYRRSFRNA